MTVKALIIVLRVVFEYPNDSRPQLVGRRRGVPQISATVLSTYKNEQILLVPDDPIFNSNLRVYS